MVPVRMREPGHWAGYPEAWAAALRYGRSVDIFVGEALVTPDPHLSIHRPGGAEPFRLNYVRSGGLSYDH